MSILVISGYQKTWCDFAYARLRQMGLQEPLPAAGSGLDPHELTEKMRKAHKIAARPGSDIHQVDPGKAWQITAADIVVQNAEQGVWGWGDPDTIHFLDFWRDFDASCRFLLLYGSPAQSLSQVLQSGEDLPEDMAQEFEAWLHYHEALLKFYNSNPKKCLLVHVSQLGDTARDLTQHLAGKFNVELRQLNATDDLAEAELVKVIAEQAARDHQSDESLFMELESSADLPAQLQHGSAPDALKAQQEYTDVRQKAASADSLAMQNSELMDRLNKVMEELQQKADVSEHEQDLEEENQLLRMQLNQVQEELEHYFSKYQEMNTAHAQGSGTQNVAGDHGKTNRKPFRVNEAGPASVELDMRSIVEGEGWHPPEAHGRWAGQSLRSSVRFPALEAGSYRATIEIVDAMSVDLAKGLKLEFNGHAIVGKLKILSNMGGRLAPLRRIKADLQQVEKPYPAEIVAHIPASLINPQEMSNRLELVSEDAVSPASQGGQDSRKLSICVKSIRLDRAI